MTPPRLTEALIAEHRVILQVIGAMAVLVEVLEGGAKVLPQTLQALTAFMRTYVERCHHEKEEHLLFPALHQLEAALPGCSLTVLEQEHRLSRDLAGQLATATQEYARNDTPATRAQVCALLRALIALYPAHIWREDYLVFPQANKALTWETERQLLHQCAEVEEAAGREACAKLKAWAELLTKVKRWF